MRIISWNVNGIRAVEKKGEIQNLVSKYDPDVLFLQEIKGTPDKFSTYINSPAPYQAFYNPAEKAGYAGTGVWIHDRIFQDFTLDHHTSFPLDPTANEGRVMHMRLQSKNNAKQVFHLFGIYFPNGGKSSEAWQGKLVFYAELKKYTDELRARGDLVLWGGDINCAHNEIDLARPKENAGKIGFHPLERAWLDDCMTDDWHDIWREKNPDTQEVYSWWDPVTRSRERNVGWRIDAFWSDKQFFDRVKNIEYLVDQYGSDHCPIMVEI